MKKVVGVIPARYGSTRFEGKPLALIKGKPMLQWVIEGAKQSRHMQDLIVATDDQRIFDLAIKCQAKAVMTDSQLPTGTDRIWGATQNTDADIIINIQGDEPLIKAQVIDALVEPLLREPSLSMATLATEIELDELLSPNVVKVIKDKNSDAIYFSRFPIPYTRSEMKKPFVCLKHIGLYGYRKEFLKAYCLAPQSEIEKHESLEQLRALHLGAKIRVIQTTFQSIGVDTKEDIQRVEKFL